MIIEGLIWLPDIVDKLSSKHHVTMFEAESILENNSLFRKIGNGHVKGEDLYRALGQTDSGRYLALFFIHKLKGEALVISGRDMSEKERKNYAKRKR
ncbi:MAG: BrnT family toxin [bacterium]|nr:BrnT family toxin [bacterium]